MPSFEFLENHPETMDFVVAAGKLLQNFGSIEWLTYEWIRGLANDPILFQVVRKISLADRLDVVRLLVEDSRFPLGSKERKEILDILAGLRPLIEVRNLVAHNPVSLGSQDGDLLKPPTVLGILNMKPKDRAKEAELISLAEINGAVNRSSEIAERLHGWLTQVENALRQKS